MVWQLYRPFISFQVERVSHRDNLRSFVQRSEELEKRCLAKAIKSYCELRVLPYERNKTVVFWQCQEEGERIIVCQIKIQLVQYFRSSWNWTYTNSYRYLLGSPHLCSKDTNSHSKINNFWCNPMLYSWFNSFFTQCIYSWM